MSALRVERVGSGAERSGLDWVGVELREGESSGVEFSGWGWSAVQCSAVPWCGVRVVGSRMCMCSVEWSGVLLECYVVYC